MITNEVEGKTTGEAVEVEVDVPPAAFAHQTYEAAPHSQIGLGEAAAAPFAPAAPYAPGALAYGGPAPVAAAPMQGVGAPVRHGSYPYAAAGGPQLYAPPKGRAASQPYAAAVGSAPLYAPPKGSAGPNPQYNAGIQLGGVQPYVMPGSQVVIGAPVSGTLPNTGRVIVPMTSSAPGNLADSRRQRQSEKWTRAHMTCLTGCVLMILFIVGLAIGSSVLAMVGFYIGALVWLVALCFYSSACCCS